MCVNEADEAIRKAIRIALAGKNMTQADLARELGVSRQGISELMVGKKSLLPERLVRIFEVLGLEVRVVEKP